MNDAQLTSLFPASGDQIPAEYHIDPIHQREYLLNGEMRSWDGPTSAVYSPICLPGPDTFPFTGRKDSAEGTLSVEDALRSFSIRSAVATKDTAANKAILNEIVGEHKSEFLSTSFIF